MKCKLEEQESELAKIMRELEEKEAKLAEALAEQQAFEKTLDEMDEKAAQEGEGGGRASRNISGMRRQLGVLSEVAEEEEDELEESRRLDEEEERRLEEIEGDIARFKKMQEEDPYEDEAQLRAKFDKGSLGYRLTFAKTEEETEQIMKEYQEEKQRQLSMIYGDEQDEAPEEEEEAKEDLHQVD